MTEATRHDAATSTLIITGSEDAIDALHLQKLPFWSSLTHHRVDAEAAL